MAAGQRLALDFSSPTGLFNSAPFPLRESSDFRSFQPGWLIAQVARFGEKGAGESRSRPSFRLRIRQPVGENRGKPAPHGEAIRRGDRLVRVEVASRTGFEPVLPT